MKLLHSFYRACLVSLIIVPVWIVQAEEPIITSPNDSRQYASLILSNELSVLLISDASTDKAAASLNVAVGSSSDPAGREGLAHFLEHMLFLGTEKYPEPGEYKQFLASHGGNHNAYTAFADTNYFFDIDKNYLEPALDRFAQFFQVPLFTAKYVDNERQVVHSEYQSKLRSDGWRMRSAQARAYNPEHPAARFNIGSVETLADRDGGTIRDELIDFYQSHYSANVMNLVVLGKEPLAVLEDWVRTKFAAIPNRHATRLLIEQPLFKPEQLPSRLDLVPIKDEKQLTLTFPLPPIKAYYRTKPTAYLSHLLGYEGKGSLLSLLKQKAWANSLWSGVGFSNDYRAALTLSIELTDAGLSALNDVIGLVFQTIRLIEQQGIQEWIYLEQQRLAEIAFQFQEPTGPLAYVRSLAASMDDYPMTELLRGPYLMTDYSSELIERFLRQLRPDNVLLTVSAQGLSTDAVEPWFEVPYRINPVDAELVKRWQSEPIEAALTLPEQNLFIPQQLTLKDTEALTAVPQSIVNEPGFVLWFQQDRYFKVPRAEFYFSVRSPLANNSARHAMLTELYVKLVEEQLNEFVYPAYVAGLEFKLYKHIRGFSVRISGYDDKQPLLLERVAAALRQPQFDSSRFARIKNDLLRSLASAKEDPPYRQTLMEVRDLLITPHWTEDQRSAALVDLELSDLQAFVPDLLERMEIVALAYGNLTREQAEAMGVLLKQHVLAVSQPVRVERGRLLKLDGERDFLRQLDVKHNDSAVSIYFQGPNKSYTSRARFALLAELVESPFFERLRTEQRLGYIVFATPMTILEVPGLAFVVQSPSADPVELEQQIGHFINDYQIAMEELDDTALANIKASLLSRILEKDKNLQQRAKYYWSEIDQESQMFDSRERIAAAVRDITKEELLVAYRNWLSGSERRRLVVRSLGGRKDTDFATQESHSTYSLIRDPNTFRHGRNAFPG